MLSRTVIKRTFFILALGCSVAIAAKPLPNLSLIKKHLIRYHDSGQYYYQIDQAEQKAQKYLVYRVAKNQKAADKKKLAIVLDIDETSLSNFHHMRQLNFGGTDKQFVQAMQKADDPAIPATLKLYRYAIAHNVAVFFVTGRKEILRQATAKNLKDAGFAQWKKLFLKPNNYDKKSAIPYKTATRKKIENKGYDIVLSVGDQYSDLAGGYADRDVKYPDPFYYVP